ncbi:MAG: DUF5809 family protein [Halobacteriales archaeon]|nr:DUF5809 family protein [Halobacteriales archaeon]
MERRGSDEFETASAARQAFEAAGPTAQIAVREATKAMGFPREEYEERVTPEVVETVRDVVFAGRLAVTVGTAEEFEAWRDSTDLAVTVIGSEHVDNAAWHAAPFCGEAVAATFQDEPDAAVETLRRQALGRIYRERFA